MPRAEFDNYDNFKRWFNGHIQRHRKSRYEAYLVAGQDLVLLPTSSTSPLVYGYIQAIDDQLSAAKQLLEAASIPLYEVVRWDWSSERQPLRSDQY